MCVASSCRANIRHVGMDMYVAASHPEKHCFVQPVPHEFKEVSSAVWLFVLRKSERSSAQTHATRACDWMGINKKG